LREQLIAAIEDNPDDVENYRVYADWLESNGQPRGKLIAMSLVLERLTDRGKREHLSRRLGEYFSEHLRTFASGLPSWGIEDMRTLYLHWRYGFIFQARLTSTTAATTQTQLRELVASPSGRFVVDIVIDSGPGAQAALDVLLEKVPRSLRRLFVQDDIDLSSAWPKLERLWHLGVDGTTARLGTIDLPNAETLMLGIEHAAALAGARLPKLEVLELPRVSAPSRLLKIFETLDAPKLDKLVFEHLDNATELVRDLSATSIGKQLVAIDLSHSDLDDTAARLWASHPPAQRLKRLDVRNTPITKVGARVLATFADRVILEDADA
jgi:uncharacterized protein (TIGR02996 family)